MTIRYIHETLSVAEECMDRLKEDGDKIKQPYPLYNDMEEARRVISDLIAIIENFRIERF